MKLSSKRLQHRKAISGLLGSHSSKRDHLKVQEESWLQAEKQGLPCVFTALLQLQLVAVRAARAAGTPHGFDRLGTIPMQPSSTALGPRPGPKASAARTRGPAPPDATKQASCARVLPTRPPAMTAPLCCWQCAYLCCLILSPSCSKTGTRSWAACCYGQTCPQTRWSACWRCVGAFAGTLCARSRHRRLRCDAGGIRFHISMLAFINPSTAHIVAPSSS